MFGFRAAHVFDISQTDGDPLPEFATAKGDSGDYAERLTQFVAAQGITLEFDQKIAPARGMSSGGKITLLPDLPPAEAFAVLAHEVAHELLHRGNRRHQTTHSLRETEAEDPSRNHEPRDDLVSPRWTALAQSARPARWECSS